MSEHNDERQKHEAALRIVDDMQTEKAWERYRDRAAVRLVLERPEPGDIRLAFEAGYSAALENVPTKQGP
jgi:negative regulator of sigma E activity